MCSKIFRYSSPYRLRRARLSGSPLRDHFHQAVVGGYLLPAVSGGLAGLRAMREYVLPLDSHHPRNVRLVTSANARPCIPGELPGSLARSGSLRFAPPASGCLAVNVQLNWQADEGAQATGSGRPVNRRAASRVLYQTQALSREEARMRWFKVAAIAAGVFVGFLVISSIIGFLMEAAIAALVVATIVLAVKVAFYRK